MSRVDRLRREGVGTLTFPSPSRRHRAVYVFTAPRREEFGTRRPTRDYTGAAEGQEPGSMAPAADRTVGRDGNY